MYFQVDGDNGLEFSHWGLLGPPPILTSAKSGIRAFPSMGEHHPARVIPVDVPIASIYSVSGSCWALPLSALSSSPPHGKLALIQEQQKGHGGFFSSRSWLFWLCSTTPPNHHVLLLGICSSQIPPVLRIICSACISPFPASKLCRSRGHLTSCSPSAPGSKLSDETIQHHLLKPRSLCAAAGTDIFIKAFELSCSTPSLWSLLTSHPSDRAETSSPFPPHLPTPLVRILSEGIKAAGGVSWPRML